jgi:hypothetical protein
MTGTNTLCENEVCFTLGNESKFEPALIFLKSLKLQPFSLISKPGITSEVLGFEVAIRKILVETRRSHPDPDARCPA